MLRLRRLLCGSKGARGASREVHAAAPPLVVPGFERTVPLSRVSPPPKMTEHVLADGTPILIVNAGLDAAGSPRLSALYALCPHKQASLALGDLEDAAGPGGAPGCSVKCPRHRKKFPGGLNFNVTTGEAWVREPSACLTRFDPAWAVAVFDVRVEADDYVYVSSSPVRGSLPPPEDSSSDEGEAGKRGGGGGGGAGGEGNSGGGSNGGGGESARSTGVSARRTGHVELALPEAGKGDDGSVTHADARVVAARGDAGAGAMLPSLAVLAPSPASPTAAAAASSTRPLTPKLRSGSVGLAPETWTEVAVTRVTQASPDTKVYRLSPVSGGAGLPVPTCDAHSWHVALRLHPDAELSREYTPVSRLAAWRGEERDEGAGAAGTPFVDLLVKLYPGGRFTSKLASVEVGSKLWVSEPRTTLPVEGLSAALSATAAPSTKAPVALAYEEEGASRSPTAAAASSASSRAASALLLMAGGTGVTPVAQLLRWAVAARTSSSSSAAAAPSAVYVVSSHHSLAHHLMLDTLKELAGAAPPGYVHLLAAVTRDASGTPAASAEEGALVPAAEGDRVSWCRGRVTPAALAAFLPPPAALGSVVVSGPSGMFEGVSAVLEAMGVEGSRLVELEA